MRAWGERALLRPLGVGRDASPSFVRRGGGAFAPAAAWQSVCVMRARVRAWFYIFGGCAARACVGRTRSPPPVGRGERLVPFLGAVGRRRVRPRGGVAERGRG